MMIRRRTIILLLLVLSLPLLLMLPVRSALAQDVHAKIRPSLVYLKATGIQSEESALAGQKVSEQATGFIISDDGLVLTTYHLIGSLGPNVDGQTVAIEATIGRKAATPQFTEVPVMNAMPLLDLLLLKLPRGTDPYKAVEIGSAANLQTSDTVFTSGFPRSDDYITDDGKLSERGGPRGHLWTMTDMQMEGGQSGSPVYDANGTVVAIAKGSNKSAPNRSYVIPMQFADPLLAHLRLARISGEVVRIDGILKDHDPKRLDESLQQLQQAIDAVRKNVEWHADFSDDRKHVRLDYRKLIGGKPHIDKVEYDLFLTGRNPRFSPNGPQQLARNSGGGEGSGGTFVMENLGTQISNLRTNMNRSEPFNEIRLDIIPILETGENLPPRTIYINDRLGLS